MLPTHPSRRPAFLVTIDTEGDNLWAKPREITTANARYLPRFQRLCEKYSLRPTWLANWEMANCPVFREFGRDVLARNAGEIGMHLHAWNSPPIVPLTDDDNFHQTFLIEYPEDVIRRKVAVMTDALEDAFGVKMTSHRAGRWAFNATYARILLEHGYRVDCSVTPHLCWSAYKGDPNGRGGADYTDFPEVPYFLDPGDIRRAGASPLLEVPLTVTAPRYSAPERIIRSLLKTGGKLGARANRRWFPEHQRFVPNGRNRRLLVRVLEAALRDGREHVDLTIHSSELMPGGSPNFPTAASVERLYETFEDLFARTRQRTQGMTLTEFYSRQCGETGRPGEASDGTTDPLDPAATALVGAAISASALQVQ